MEAERDQQPSTEKSLSIEWHIAENIQSRYATNMLIQTGSSEFFLSFFEIQPPIAVGSPEEQKAYVEQLKTVRAECVGRIIVSADFMPKVIEALQANYEGYRAAKANQEGEVK